MGKIFFAAAALSIAMINPVMAEDLSFNLVNKAGSAVVAFHVSHTGTKQWEENLLAGHYLPNGNQIDIIIADGRTTCVYDILTEFKDGDTVEDYNLDLCQLGSYTLHR